MTYKIFFSDNPEQLEETITNLMAEGWKPCGGVSVSQSDAFYAEDIFKTPKVHFSIVFAQAMIK